MIRNNINFRYFLLELCAATLSDYCVGDYTGAMPSDVEALHQMASGLYYIHSKKFVHRDIKADNVMISLVAPIHLKISDFGFCKPTSERGSFSFGKSGNKINFITTAPEILEKMDKSVKQKGDMSSDVFSLGCLFYTFLTKGKHLFLLSGQRNSFLVPANIIAGKYSLAGLLK